MGKPAGILPLWGTASLSFWETHRQKLSSQAIWQHRALWWRTRQASKPRLRSRLLSRRHPLPGCWPWKCQAAHLESNNWFWKLWSVSALLQPCLRMLLLRNIPHGLALLSPSPQELRVDHLACSRCSLRRVSMFLTTYSPTFITPFWLTLLPV